FEESAASGGYVGHLFLDAGMGQGSDGVAAAGNGDQLAVMGAPGNVPGNGHGASVEGVHLEGTDRAVPDHGVGVVDGRLDALDRGGADIEDHAILVDGVDAIEAGRGV